MFRLRLGPDDRDKREHGGTLGHDRQRGHPATPRRQMEGLRHGLSLFEGGTRI